MSRRGELAAHPKRYTASRKGLTNIKNWSSPMKPEDRWQEFARSNPVGSRTTGEVETITDFGIFVTLEEHADCKIQGVVHCSEIGRNPGEELENIFRRGEMLEVIITKIDADNQSCSVSIVC